MSVHKLGKRCESCLLYKRSGCSHPYIKSKGSPAPKYIVVSDSVHYKADVSGNLLDGSYGSRLKKAFKSLEIDLDEVLFTSAVRCHTKTKDPKAQEFCGGYTRDLINKHKPKGVLCMGDDAIRAVFPKSFPRVYSSYQMRGSVVPYFLPNKQIVPCSITLSNDFMDSADEATEQVWYDDIGSLTEGVNISVDLKPNIIPCLTFDKVKELSGRLKTEPITAWDFETTHLKPFPQTGEAPDVYTVAFAFDNGDTYAVPMNGYYPTNMDAAIRELVGAFFYDLNPTQIKVAHNVKFDLLWGIHQLGDKLNSKPLGSYQDTSLYCWMLDERVSMSRLKVAAWRYFGVANWSVDAANITTYPIEEVLTYNAYDAFYTLRLYQHLKPLAENSKQSKKLYEDLLLPATSQFMKMEMSGVTVNNKKRKELYDFFNSKIDSSQRMAKKKANNIDLKIGSPKDLQHYFVNVCKYKMPKKNKTGYSTDEGVLKYLVETYNDEVAKASLDHRQYSKLQNTYIQGLSKNIYTDNKIHGSYNLTATVTGRTSSSDPNMQNFPKRKNKEIRSLVIPKKDHLFVSFDYGQIEARLFAIVTGDEQYLEDLNNQYDIHTERALWVYRDQLGNDKEYAIGRRSDMKAGIFGIFYGAGDHTTSRTLGISMDIAKDLKRSIFTRYPAIKKWQQKIVEFEAENGYIESLFGRRRRSPISYNMLLNYIYQSTASDMTLTAMVYLGKIYDIAIMIHDELVFQLPDDDELEYKIQDITKAMLTLPWMFLKDSPQMKEYAPLLVECEVGNNWADLELRCAIDSIEAGFPDLEAALNYANELKEKKLIKGW